MEILGLGPNAAQDAGGASPEDRYEELIGVIRRVRSRWRTRRLLLGGAVLAVAALGAFGLASVAIEAARYAPWVVRSLAVLTWGVVAAVVWGFLLRPLRSRVSDRRVALYVEEHDPTLRETVLSGVELGEGASRRSAGVSRELTRLVVEEAIRRCEDLDQGRRIETGGLRRAAGALATAVGVAVVASVFAPAELWRGAGLLMAPWSDIEDRNPYRVLVEPGDAAIARDADLWVAARLEGFDTGLVDLHFRTGDAVGWEVVAMEPDPEGGGFRHLFLGVPDATDYFVDADGVRSPAFRIEVEDVPYVARVGLLYEYPAHTGLSPREVEDGGDIAAVAGTRVRLVVEPTIPAAAGILRVDPGESEVALSGVTPPDGTEPVEGFARLTAELTLAESGAYRVALAGPDGVLRSASRDYRIEVLEDLPPIVRFLRPGRDLTLSPVEELFTEVRAEDDFALDRVEIRVSVNGGPESGFVLASGGARPEVQSGHTIFLEEHDLVPGDLVSYYASARDGAGAASATDMFFVAIRPFDRTYRQADSMPGGGGAGMGEGLDGTLTLRQRQIVVATFKVLRDRETMPAAAVSETVATLGLAQGRLREQVGTLNRRLRNRGIGLSAEFGEIVQHLDAGLAEMAAAEELLVAGDPEAALPREQKALTHLQRADAVFRDVQVAFNQAGGGGGGGGAPPQAEDLADLFELEMDKLRNQYETVEQSRRASTDNEVDEILERLAELARRQEQENERQRRGLARPPGGGGGGSQDQVAAETEDLARRLERLAREQSRPDLAAVSRRLREAASQMRAANSRNPGEGLESGMAAANSLRGARRDLDEGRRTRLARDVELAEEEAKRLRSVQERIRSAVRDLDRERTRGAVNAISEQKEELAARVQGLERRLDEVSRDWSGEEPDASEAVGRAADGIRDRKLKEKIHYSRGVAAQRSSDYADQFEGMISRDLEALEEDLAAARQAVEGSDRAEQNAALDQAEALVRGLEAMRNRLAERARPGGENEADRAGESGRTGEPGQQGQSGQQGESRPGESGQGEAGAEGESPSRESSEGAPGGGGGPGGRRDEARQLRAELDRRVRDAEGLRRELSGIGQSGEFGAERLDDVVASLRGLNPERLIGDPRGMEILEAEVLDTLRELEFDLRRALSGEDVGDVLTGDAGRAPEAYREMVEEYFRNLSREPSSPR